MAAEKKTKQAENGLITLTSIGSCPIVLSPSVVIAPGDSFDVSEDQVNSQAFKHLFVTGSVEFKDDAGRTAEYLEKAREKLKEKDEPATIAEAEGKENKEF